MQGVELFFEIATKKLNEKCPKDTDDLSVAEIRALCHEAMKEARQQDPSLFPGVSDDALTFFLNNFITSALMKEFPNA